MSRGGGLFISKILDFWVDGSAMAFVACALNNCNQAKSPGIGRLQIRLVYFAPNAGIFYPIKTVYHTRRWFCTATWCVAVAFYEGDGFFVPR